MTVEIDVKVEMMKGGLSHLFINQESITKALTQNISVCQRRSLLIHIDRLTCKDLHCDVCPFDKDNKVLLKQYINTNPSLLPDPYVCEITNVNKYFPTIIEL